VMSAGVKKDIQLTLGQRSQTEYVLRESPQANAEQLARRAAWLRSEGQPSSPAPSTR
jgi:hypothetical protein